MIERQKMDRCWYCGDILESGKQKCGSCGGIAHHAESVKNNKVHDGDEYYCKFCGLQLVLKDTIIVGYGRKTGQPIMKAIYECPSSQIGMHRTLEYRYLSCTGERIGNFCWGYKYVKKASFMATKALGRFLIKNKRRNEK
jgi:hypothetical protein